MGLYTGLTIEATLDPKAQPFLHDHQIDGTPVLPGVMGIEAFAEAALSVLPGWHIKAIEDVNFLAPFKFYRHETRTVTVEATLRAQGEEMVADCRLIGRRALPNQSDPQITTHFTARVRLSKLAPGSTVASTPGSQIEPLIEAADVYRLYFHGPAYQVLEKAWWDGKPDDRATGERSSKQSPPVELADTYGAAADRAVFSDRRALGNGSAGSYGSTATLRSGLVVAGVQNRSMPGCTQWLRPGPREPSMPRWSMPKATGTFALAGYRTVAMPGAVRSGSGESPADNAAYGARRGLIVDMMAMICRSETL